MSVRKIVMPCSFEALSCLEARSEIVVRATPADALKEFAFAARQRGHSVIGTLLTLPNIAAIVETDILLRASYVAAGLNDFELLESPTLRDVIGLDFSGVTGAFRVRIRACDSSDIMVAKTLASLGVPVLVDFFSANPPKDELADLMAWALLSPAQRGACDPFTGLSLAVQDSRAVKLAEFYLDDPNSYAWMDERGSVATNRADLDAGLARSLPGQGGLDMDERFLDAGRVSVRALMAEGGCGQCPGLYLCGTYMKERGIDIGACRPIIEDMLDTIEAKLAKGRPHAHPDR